MKKEKRILHDVVERMAIRVAKMDANTACPCISYQPKLPEAVKKLRKSLK
ncbi:MAG: cyclic lactone autoinducer peptide [Lachnospiraceae bacterium]|nr:cyclic lactone autoinducer peptide [Lachnospiraceae bacterium]